MVITVPAPQWPPNGPRPINLKQDIPQVADLLELAFGEKLDSEGRRAIRHSPNGNPAFLWRLGSQQSRLPPGYVWQENGRIIGNVTLIATKIPGRHIIANVAVHPDYRRRGIARTLMQSVLEQVRARHGNVVVLQVVKDNASAIQLYEDLRFLKVGTMTEWRSTISRLQSLPDNRSDGAKTAVTPLRKQQWQAAYRLDTTSQHPDLTWPEPISPEYYRWKLWGAMNDFLYSRFRETWATTTSAGQLAGLATISAEWGRPYFLSLRIHPNWRGHLERPLLAKLIRRLQSMTRRNIIIHHMDNDDITNQLLEEARFTPRRTLTHMRLDI
ncbi:MAG: GNAT family N-acetyltransferase [Ardenticatenaceae bacterium]|nr:GNAT family N-acetyltransferase [Anaerolineales bacterium]MCB8922704.1 GNAT family N-acetyltransferase [Ardenticatenaceae bacterium]MCB9003588.1 GNAT family N-acetyltransferase [Ardenticatenaceae bacterium]